MNSVGVYNLPKPNLLIVFACFCVYARFSYAYFFKTVLLKFCTPPCKISTPPENGTQILPWSRVGHGECWVWVQSSNLIPRIALACYPGCMICSGDAFCQWLDDSNCHGLAAGSCSLPPCCLVDSTWQCPTAGPGSSPYCFPTQKFSYFTLLWISFYYPAVCSLFSGRLTVLPATIQQDQIQAGVYSNKQNKKLLIL